MDLQPGESTPLSNRPHRVLHVLAIVTVVLSLVLITSGGIVTGKQAGLSVPDWPNTFGHNMFTYPLSEMLKDYNVFYEHSHRLIGSIIGLCSIGLAGGLLFSKDRRWPGWLGAAVIIGVVTQGVLGGLRVRMVSTNLAIVHACVAQTFFALLTAVAVVTSPRWRKPLPRITPTHRPSLRTLVVLCMAAGWLQLILGAMLRHGEKITMANGRVHMHITGAVVVAAMIGWLGVRILRRHADQPVLDRIMKHLIYVLFLQIALGAAALVAVIVTQDSANPYHPAMIVITTAHVVVGAVLLGSLAVAAMIVFRMTAPGAAAERSGGDGGSGFRQRAGDYLALTKPGLTSLVLFTTFVGFYLGSETKVDAVAWLHAMIGTALAAAGACTLNQVLEHEIDARMRRTANRPLPAGRLGYWQAMTFGAALALGGTLYLLVASNPLAAGLAATTVAAYLFAYTPLKRVTYLCTIVGAVPGAIPPLIGWAAAQGRLELGAWVLFGILFFWQVPHFYAIARLYREDYARANLPMLPVIDPSGVRTARQSLLFLAGLLPLTLLPTLIGLTGLLYLVVSVLLGGVLFYAGVELARRRSVLHARRLFLGTVAYLPVLLAAMMWDKAGL